METVQQSKTHDTSEAIFEELADPDVQESLVILIRRLPTIAKAVVAAERGIELATAIAGDKATLASLGERAESALNRLNVDQETFESLLVLIEKLPKMVKIVTKLEQMYDLLEAVATDKQSLAQILDGVKEFASPITQPISDGMTILQEAKGRVDSVPRISLIGMMRMMNDPTVQKGLRMMQAVLDVMAERNKT